MRERDGERNSDREMFWRRRKIERETRLRRYDVGGIMGEQCWRKRERERRYKAKDSGSWR